MSEAAVFLGFALLLVGAVSLVKNKDLFSPSKFYLLYITFFYANIYFTETAPAIYVVYFIFIVSIAVAVLLEVKEVDDTFNKLRVPRRVFYAIWLLTLPGLVVKLYFIYEAGGLIEYLNVLAFRVQAWRGKGYLIIWFYMIPTLNLLYFVYLLFDSGATRLKWMLYFCHFAIFLLVGVLTASRSIVAMTIVGMVVGYSYFSRKIGALTLVSVFLVLVTFVGVFGALRNSYGGLNAENIASSPISTELPQMEATHFSYGLIPLEIVFSDNGLNNLYLGSTYLSLVTNFVPRVMFPDKFRTGGIAFTQDYANNQWGGLSHLATGAVTEAVINFGYFWGVIIGCLFNLLLLVAGVIFYNRWRGLRKVSSATPIVFVCYFYTLLSFSRFTFSEFTDLWQSLFVFCFGPCFLVLLSSGTVLKNICSIQSR